MDRVSYVLRRLLYLIPVAVGVTILVFFMVHMIPGDPARTMLGTRATNAQVAALHHEWGLDRPLYAQYGLFMDRLIHGNLGQSFYYRQSAMSLVLDRLPATLWLLVYGTILSVLISVPLALLAASKKDAIRDQTVRAVPLLGLGMPSFWIGIMLVLLLALRLRLFPVGGFGTGFLGHVHAMFLPSLTIAVVISPILIRSLRAGLLGVLSSDYVTTARSKGVSEPRVMMRHALPNAAISTVTILGVNIAFLVGNTLVIEKVFAIPGVGQLMIDSIFNRDFSVVQAVTLVFAVIVVLVNLMTDVAYSLLDPRVRFDS